ncbi:hypothetical protein I552_0061 [Mycobacterium xenopi 3993]|nr:hypothetical protein I552_0061 [Mycobacterium xenopi 3993]
MAHPVSPPSRCGAVHRGCGRPVLSFMRRDRATEVVTGRTVRS